MIRPRFQPVNFDVIMLGRGWDQVTPTLSLDNGFTRESNNFECGVNGGNSRILGYERFSGQTSPSSTDVTSEFFSVASYTNTLSVGDTITGQSSSETAVVAYIDGLRFGVTKVSGDFELEQINVGATEIGTIDDLQAGPNSILESAKAKNAIADIYRADISAPPGSGAIRGVVVLPNDVVYAFRDNAGATAVDIYKSSSSGWVNVPLYKTVLFTAGGTTTPAEGSTLTQGGVTATIERVVLESGEFSGSNAAGQFIISNVSGGNFSAGAATADTASVTLSAAESQISLLPGGRFSFIVTNFAGGLTTERAYGADGVNKAFEFDGNILVPINTGATTDTPKHIIKYRDFLFLSIGTSFYYSVAGEPYNFEGSEGAGNKATGATITGFSIMPGDSTVSTLAIFQRSDFGILYGKTPSDFNFVQYDVGAGCVDYTNQNMTDILAFDDRGLSQVKTTLSFGNFVQSTLTDQIYPYINEKIGLAVASTLNRRKSQYRVFFSDKDALYISIVNGKLKGAMPVSFEHVVNCTWEGKLSTGEDVSFFGGADGMLYQLDKGTSFDGENIDFSFTLNYSPARSPRIKKRYRKAAFEISTLGQSVVECRVGYSLGYDSDEYAQKPLIDAYTKDIAQTRWDSDTFVWDESFWDSSGIGPVEVRVDGTAENIAFSFSGLSDYIDEFTVNSIVVHYTTRRVMR